MAHISLSSAYCMKKVNAPLKYSLLATVAQFLQSRKDYEKKRYEGEERNTTLCFGFLLSFYFPD